MYDGEVQIEEDRLKEFMRTAEMLQIQGLAQGGGGATGTEAAGKVSAADTAAVSSMAKVAEEDADEPEEEDTVSWRSRARKNSPPFCPS